MIRFGPFTLDGRSGELRNGPTRLKVPDQSIAVLQALLERPGELVTREALRDRLWGPDTFVDFEAGLNAAVRRLREALNDSADTPRYVETLPRRGYRFIAPVDVVSTGLPAAPRAGSRRRFGSRSCRAGAGSTTGRATCAACAPCACAPRRGTVGRTETRQCCTDRVGSEAGSRSQGFRDWSSSRRFLRQGTSSPLPGTARTKTTSTSTCDRSMAALSCS